MSTIKNSEQPTPNEQVVKPQIGCERRHLLVCTGARCSADGVSQAPTWYYNATPENMDRIISEHLCHGRRVEDLVFHQAAEA